MPVRSLVMFLLHFTLSDKVPEKGIKYDEVLQVRPFYTRHPFFRHPFPCSLHATTVVLWASVPNELTVTINEAELMARRVVL